MGEWRGGLMLVGLWLGYKKGMGGEGMVGVTGDEGGKRKEVWEKGG